MVIRLQALRYGQMVALFGSPSACKQWGTLVGPKTDDWVWVTTTFPIAFASACFSVSCCDEITNYDYDDNVEFMARKLQKASVDIRFRSDHFGRNVRWIALGV